MDSDSDEAGREAALNQHTFVLRIRRDPTAQLPLRATIRHLPSGGELSTSDLTEIEDFVRLRVDDPEDHA